ncbi:hypothetical protein IPZ58_36785 [Streptomyces roseoverticillatus]|uniref:hypothetical protein n=1 Tax=Streptomyces roseoverticillatus TaxID=66429 RepID=UPI001F442658|nr:hypothetical protein [Streptomyces roseoverticillatus]MCF3107071.1 hypothetical protein [Streptomyces roseoverticillatus]
MPNSMDGPHRQNRIERRHQLCGGDFYEVCRSTAVLQSGHVLDNLGAGEHVNPLTQGAHGMNPSAISRYRPNVIAQAVHRGPYDLTSDTKAGTRSDDAPLS